MEEKESPATENPGSLEQQMPASIQQVLASYLKRYGPSSESAATYRPTTRELLDMMEEHTGNAISPSELFDFLVKQGFTYQPLQGSIVWLMGDRS